MEIYLLRHGQTEANSEGRYRGWTESHLSARGVEQAQKTGDYLFEQGIQRLFSSDLSRALQTAQAIGEKCGLKPFPSPLLREIHFGRWEGLTYEEIQASYQEEFTSWIKDPFRRPVPCGEDLATVYRRMKRFLKSLKKAGLEGKKVVVVSHGGIIRATLFYLQKMREDDFWDLEVGNGSLSLLRVEGNDLKVEYYNWTGHLN